jgi:hypothetical protein
VYVYDWADAAVFAGSVSEAVAPFPSWAPPERVQPYAVGGIEQLTAARLTDPPSLVIGDGVVVSCTPHEPAPVAGVLEPHVIVRLGGVPVICGLLQDGMSMVIGTLSVAVSATAVRGAERSAAAATRPRPNAAKGELNRVKVISTPLPLQAVKTTGRMRKADDSAV